MSGLLENILLMSILTVWWKTMSCTASTRVNLKLGYLRLYCLWASWQYDGKQFHVQLQPVFIWNVQVLLPEMLFWMSSSCLPYPLECFEVNCIVFSFEHLMVRNISFSWFVTGICSVSFQIFLNSFRVSGCSWVAFH